MLASYMYRCTVERKCICTRRYVHSTVYMDTHIFMHTCRHMCVHTGSFLPDFRPWREQSVSAYGLRRLCPTRAISTLSCILSWLEFRKSRGPPETMGLIGAPCLRGVRQTGLAWDVCLEGMRLYQGSFAV